MKNTLFALFSILLCLNTFGGDGKIIFSKSPITGEIGETTFDISDKIYCKAITDGAFSEQQLFKYGNKDMGKATDKPNSYEVYVFIDDFKDFDKNTNVGSKSFCNTNEKTDNNLADKTSFEFILNSSDEAGNHVKFNEMLGKLSNGKHKVKVVVWAFNGYNKTKKPIAIGEFEYNKTENSKVKLGNKFSPSITGMKDPKLESKMLEHLKQYEKTAANNSKLTKYTTLKLTITSKDWIIKNHPSTGAIMYRYVQAIVLLKKEDGSCRLAERTFGQQYTGPGFLDSFMDMGSQGFSYGDGAAADCD